MLRQGVLHGGAQGLRGGEQGAFRVFLQQVFVHRAQLGIGFFQQVLHALVGGGKGGGFGQFFKRLNGLQFVCQVVQTVGMLRQHGGNGVLRVIVLQQHRQTRLHKIRHFGNGVRRQQIFGELRGNRVQQVIDRQGTVHQHPQHAQCRTAQRVGVFVARGNQPNAPNAHQRFQFIRQRHSGRNRAFGQFVARKTRLIVLLNRGGDFRLLTIQHGIIFAHRALQFGEFAHHFGNQIGFGKPRGAFGGGTVCAQLLGDVGGDGLQTLNALGLAANFIMINNVFQLRQTAFQRRLLVLFVEKFRIRQTRPQHALVAVDDVAGVGGLQIGNQQKAVH